MAALEAKARHVMLLIGLGFMAFVTGGIISGSLVQRLSPRLAAADSRVLDVIAAVMLQHLWILIVLPVLIHLCARFLELHVWRAAVVGAVTGTMFNATIRVIGSGFEETFTNPVGNVIWLGAFVSGLLITVWAGKQGRAWASARQTQADAAAAARKAQYDQFLAESTALADKRDAARPAEPPAEPPKPS